MGLSINIEITNARIDAQKALEPVVGEELAQWMASKLGRIRRRHGALRIHEVSPAASPGATHSVSILLNLGLMTVTPTTVTFIQDRCVKRVLDAPTADQVTIELADPNSLQEWEKQVKLFDAPDLSGMAMFAAGLLAAACLIAVAGIACVLASRYL